MANVNFVNLTPHAIVLNDGTVDPPSGTVARVSSTHTPFNENKTCEVVFGEVEGLPAPYYEANLDGNNNVELLSITIYIVSGMVASAIKRYDVVSPATGHPDCVRENGQVKSVPGFVRVLPSKG
jgi:hypothetical protein